jgi:hypothetical protein
MNGWLNLVRPRHFENFEKFFRLLGWPIPIQTSRRRRNDHKMSQLTFGAENTSLFEG